MAITTLEDRFRTRKWPLPFHWALDVSFDEDTCRVRVGDGAQNLAILRRIALNLLKQNKTVRAGLNNKRQRAGWDIEYL